MRAADYADQRGLLRERKRGADLQSIALPYRSAPLPLPQFVLNRVIRGLPFQNFTNNPG